MIDKKRKSILPLNYLIKRNYIDVPLETSDNNLSKEEVATLLNNLSYYGYTINHSIANYIVKSADRDAVLKWFSLLEKNLKEITKEDKNISDHIVYKNFPKEFIDMTEFEYWINQLFIYIGLFDYENLDRKDREKLDEEIVSLKVLSRIPENVDYIISNDLVSFKSSWSFEQKEEAELLNLFNDFKLTDFGFKENGIYLLAKEFLNNNQEKIIIEDASDVLKLVYKVAELSESEKEFPKFSRPQRRFLLEILENTKNLEEDIALNKKSWKKFLTLLHPHEYNYNRVSTAFFKLCKNRIKGFNSLFNQLIQNKDKAVFDLLNTRAGVFSNSLYQLYTVFGEKAFEEFRSVIHNVDTKKLLKIRNYFKTYNKKEKSVIFSGKNNTLVFCDINFIENNNSINEDKEKTNSSEALLNELKNNKKVNLSDFINKNENFNFYQDDLDKSSFKKDYSGRYLTLNKSRIKKEHIDNLLSIIDSELHNRALEITDGKFIDLDENLKNVKFKDNSNENILFGSGTSFDIPKEAKFIRTASFWVKQESNSVWIDNSLNFFNKNFEPVGECCWNRPHQKYAVFSGDPVVKYDRPSAAQLIDVDINEAINNNVRYITMSALSFNRIPFSEFQESFMSVQYCEDPQKGKPYETKRVDYQFDFVKSNNLDRLFVLFDLKERKMIFIDKSLKMHVSSAIHNSDFLSKYLGYELNNIKNAPSIYDLFETLHYDSSLTKFVYSDKDKKLDNDIKHFVFRKQNLDNQVDLYNIDSFI